MPQPGPSGGNSGKFYIKAPREWTPGQPYTETPRAKGEVRFVLPGARRKQAAQQAVTPFNSSDTPQPFLDPEVLERWRREKGK